MTTLAVAAVGGNALTGQGQKGTPDQLAGNAAEMAAALAALHRTGTRLVVVHGNGPQVGNLALQQESAARSIPPQPLHQLCAMTQGQLGSLLVRALDRELGLGAAVCLVTHVVVDPADPAFDLPTKPIGPSYNERQAKAQAHRWQLAEEAGRGWRRVVASPYPQRIVEIDALRTLLTAGQIVIAAGGGGIAVQEGTLTGIDAVIDKDHAATVVALALGAADLYLLTGVDSVQLDFGSKSQHPVRRMSPAEAAGHLADGQFAAGSMGPKVAAALAFVQRGGRRAVITSVGRLAATLIGDPQAGTIIEASPAASRTAS